MRNASSTETKSRAEASKHVVAWHARKTSYILQKCPLTCGKGYKRIATSPFRSSIVEIRTQQCCLAAEIKMAVVLPRTSNIPKKLKMFMDGGDNLTSSDPLARFPAIN
ncbi:jg4575 [Pararge aegeria aegeria]|uniref:Jg4575 protein n=1 Tax=Pararge aegeria aegeria TaxID=348720 RepID=A0A8S4RQK7_9NEOP|nr:jg4575 [Pararge aegeria aegeria]